jgi:LysM repeat protein
LTYIIQSGDTLWSIAAKFGVSAQAIASANQMFNPNVLVVGRQLYIPIPPSQGTPPVGLPAPGGGNLENRVANLERDLSQVTAIIDHHRQRMAALEKRVTALERKLQ